MNLNKQINNRRRHKQCSHRKLFHLKIWCKLVCFRCEICNSYRSLASLSFRHFLRSIARLHNQHNRSYHIWAEWSGRQWTACWSWGCRLSLTNIFEFNTKLRIYGKVQITESGVTSYSLNQLITALFKYQAIDSRSPNV